MFVESDNVDLNFGETVAMATGGALDAGGVKLALLHAMGLARTALLSVWGGFADGPRTARESAEASRLRTEVAMLREELRIKDARIRIPAHQRPHHPPAERWAILQLRAAAGWTVAETAEHFSVTPVTISNWMRRVDEAGPTALVRTPVPVNRFPDAVAVLVAGLRGALPDLGTRRVARTLARAGLHLAHSTVRRLSKQTPSPPPPKAPPQTPPSKPRRVQARKPHDVWHVDITQVPIFGGSWVPWLPQAVLPVWPFAWHVVVAIDNVSRAPVASGVFKRPPRGSDICAVLEAGVTRHGPPRTLISDKGRQFTSRKYTAWCRRHGVETRYGAVGKHGSIAVVERFIKSLKDECLRRIIVPLSLAEMQAEVAAYLEWYTRHRPHTTLKGATPDEVFVARRGVRWSGRDLRATWLVGSWIASARAPINEQVPGAPSCVRYAAE